MAGNDGNWLVVDSEGEDAFAGLPPAMGPRETDRSTMAAGHPTSPDTSVIQTASFTPARPRTPQRGSQSPLTLADESPFTPPLGRVDSTIENFTSIPLPSAMPPMVQRPRPKPRLVMKKAAVDNTDSFPHISNPISTTRRTNDSIQPTTSTSIAFSDTIGDAYSSIGIAERAKLRSRKKPEAAQKMMPPSGLMNEVIELTSDEDEIAIKPTKRQKKQGNSRSRPKPTLKVKPAETPNGSPSSGTMPLSTFPTIPPSTPPQARELTPLSSPFVVTRKRKRVRPSISEDDAELDIIDDNFIGGCPSLPEPPPFFAPSSSSLPTDSGIEIPPVGSPSGRGSKKGKRGTQAKTRNKGKKGKKTGPVAGSVKEIADITQEASIPGTCVGGCHSPVVRSPRAARTNRPVSKTAKARAVDSCEEDELIPPVQLNVACTPPAYEEEVQKVKENLRPDELSHPKRDPPERTSGTPGLQARGFTVKPKATPMSELIRRVNSQPSSPFPNATRTYSPFLKSSRTMLAKIAPLHPNRRTPPPPLPRPPPPKKSKKQIEMEERIEDELAETIDGWSCLTDEERKALRKARIDAELGYE